MMDFLLLVAGGLCVLGVVVLLLLATIAVWSEQIDRPDDNNDFWNEP